MLASDGKSYSFSRLSDALKAYDAYVLRRNDGKVKPSEINLPHKYVFETATSR